MKHQHINRASLREFILTNSKRRIAKALGVTYQTVLNWQNLQTMPTYSNMSVILRLTKGKISLKKSRLQFLEARRKEIDIAHTKALRVLKGQPLGLPITSGKEKLKKAKHKPHKKILHGAKKKKSAKVLRAEALKRHQEAFKNHKLQKLITTLKKKDSKKTAK